MGVNASVADDVTQAGDPFHVHRPRIHGVKIYDPYIRFYPFHGGRQMQRRPGAHLILRGSAFNTRNCSYQGLPRAAFKHVMKS
jgi:hypothetical protein